MKNIKEDGFITIELLAVIAIILVTILITTIGRNMVTETKIQEEINMLISDFNYMKIYSQKAKKEVEFKIINKNEYKLDMGRKSGKNGFESKTVKLEYISINSYNKFKFNNKGKVSSSGTITVTKNNKEKSKIYLTVRPVTGFLGEKSDAKR